MNGVLEKLVDSPKALLLLAFALGVIFPIIGGVLSMASCPAPAGLAYFPFVSARCVGEFIGNIGIFCFGLPGFVLSFFVVSFIQAFIKPFSSASPRLQFIVFVVIGLMINFLIYFVGLGLFFILIRAIPIINKKQE